MRLATCLARMHDEQGLKRRDLRQNLMGIRGAEIVD
jgi:hypothetical protein